LAILLLLSETPVAGILTAVDRKEQVEAIICANPVHAWQAAKVAATLSIGTSILRRQLNGGGISFREMLLSVRMATAGTLLGASGYSVTQAAQSAGYVNKVRIRSRRASDVSLSPASSIRSA
jgi:AraC-like DNA-binding protein